MTLGKLNEVKMGLDQPALISLRCNESLKPTFPCLKTKGFLHQADL